MFKFVPLGLNVSNRFYRAQIVKHNIIFVSLKTILMYGFVPCIPSYVVEYMIN